MSPGIRFRSFSAGIGTLPIVMIHDGREGFFLVDTLLEHAGVFSNHRISTGGANERLMEAVMYRKKV